MEKKGKHFVLIHGAAHGAWCWYKVVASLTEASGHRVTALDMAACGINFVPLEAVSTFDDYFRPLLDFMDALPAREKVVLVAHSMGGLGISLAMERFPEKILVAVFVTAVMPGPNMDYISFYHEFIRAIGKGGGMDRTYNQSPPEALSLARLLMRLSPSMGVEQFGKLLLTEEKYGSVDRVYMIGDDELFYTQDFVKWMIHMNPVPRMITISSADHMVMFSNPVELCSCLDEIAHNY